MWCHKENALLYSKINSDSKYSGRHQICGNNRFVGFSQWSWYCQINWENWWKQLSQAFCRKTMFKRRYYFYVNATPMKCILLCALFRFSSKTVSYEDGMPFIFGHMCINTLYLSNTANSNKIRVMVNYLLICSIRYHTKNACPWFVMWKINFQVFVCTQEK